MFSAALKCNLMELLRKKRGFSYTPPFSILILEWFSGVFLKNPMSLLMFSKLSFNLPI